MRKKSLTKNFSIYMLKSFFAIVVPLIMTPYASRILGPIGIGKVQYSQSWVSYFILVATLGIPMYAIRQGAKVKNDIKSLKQLCSEIFALSILFTCISCSLFFLFLAFFNQVSDYRVLLSICGVSIVANGLNTEWLCSVFEEYTYISKRYIALQSIAIVLLFLIVRSETDVCQYAVVLIFPIVTAAIINFKYSRNLVDWHVKFNIRSLRHLKPIICIFGINLASTIYTTLDSTMLGYLQGDYAVGIYTAASRLTKSVVSLVTATCTVFLPRLAYYAGTGQKKEYITLAQKAIEIILTVAIPCSAGLIVLASEFIELLSGSQFLVAAVPMRILAVDLIFSVLNGFLAWQVLLPMNKEKELLIATTTGLGVDAALNYWLIPKYNVGGAAIATLLAEVVVFIVCLQKCGALIPLRKILKSAVRYSLCVMPFFAIKLIMGQIFVNYIIRCLFTIALCILFYGICMLYCKNDVVMIAFDKIRQKMQTRKKKS